MALIVPLVADRGWSAERLEQIHRPSILQAEALGRLGWRVRLIVDGARAHRIPLDHNAALEIVAGPSRRGPVPLAHLVAAARRPRPDALHLFHLLDTRTLAAVAMTRIPAFAEFNAGLVPSRPSRRALMRWASGRLAGVFFTSSGQAEAFREGGALARGTPVHLVPEISCLQTPKVARDQARAELGVRASPLVLVVARAAPFKDPFVALDAFDAIVARRPEARLVWLALEEGPLHAMLLHRVAAERWSPRVRMEVAAPKARVAQWMAAADVMLHPSRREVCGFAFVEAMQSGLPIAATDIPPFRALAGADGAALVPVGSAEDLAQAALRLVDDPQAGLRAQARFRSALTYDAIALRKSRAYAGHSPQPAY